MKIYDIERAYNNGIEDLHMGGLFQNECFFREKDVLEDNYSNPIFYGRKEIIDIKDATVNPEVKLFNITFNDGSLLLTEEELNAGLIEK